MMKNNHGHIVTIASVAGLLGTYNCTDYSASKFAVIGYHESLFHELKVCKNLSVSFLNQFYVFFLSLLLLFIILNYVSKVHGFDGIHMTLVCPYLINTGMFHGVQPRFVKSRMIEKQILREF